MIDLLAHYYPGRQTLDFIVIVTMAVTIVSAAGVAMSFCLNRRPAAAHAVLLAALVASLASPWFALGFVASGKSFFGFPLFTADYTQTPRYRTQNEARQAFEAIGQRGLENPAQGSSQSGIVRSENPIGGSAELNPSLDDRASVPASTMFRSVLVIGLLAWLCGSLLVAYRLFRGARFVARLRRSMRPLNAESSRAFDEALELLAARTMVSVGQSPLAVTPMAFGLLRPRIVLPAALSHSISHAQLRDVLVHELAHVERADPRVTLLQGIATALFWPIPSVHSLNRRLERAREEICDNYVLACRDAVSYGQTLLRVAELACRGTSTCAALGILRWRGKLEDRILGLIEKERSKMTAIHPWLAVGVAAAFLSISALLCGTTFVRAENAGPPPAAAPPTNSAAQPNRKPAAPAATNVKSRPQYDQDGPSVAEQAAERAALDALASVYGLKPGEVLKAFSSPFPTQRGAYVDALFPKAPHATSSLDGYIWIIFNWQERLSYKGANVHSSPAGLGRRLLDLLTCLLDCPEQAVEGDEKLLSKGVAADWVVREATPQEIVESLAKTLGEQFNLPVKITVDEQERDVFVLKGKYRDKAGAGRLEIYGHEIIDAGKGGGGDGSFNQMLTRAGDWSKCRIIAEVEDAPEHVAWHFNWREPFTKELLAQDQNPDAVVRHLCEQTGLTLSKEKRRVSVILVEAVK